MKRIFLTCILGLSIIIIITGCNKEDEKYNSFLEKIDKLNLELKIKDETVYLNDNNDNNIEYYISEDNEAYLLFYRDLSTSHYLLAYNITNNQMISFNSQDETHCTLENYENSDTNQIKCEEVQDEEEMSKDKSETIYLLYIYNEFTKDNNLTKEELAENLSKYYKNEKNK